MFDSEEKYCHKCNKNILKNNYELHVLRCQGGSYLNTTIQAVASRQRKHQIPRIFKDNNSYQQQEELIICPNCRQALTYSQLDTHQMQCEQAEICCMFCHQKYPKSLIQEHQKVCPIKNNFRQQEEQDQLYQLSERSHPIRHPTNQFYHPQERPHLFRPRIQFMQRPSRIQLFFSGMRHNGQGRAVDLAQNFMQMLEEMSKNNGSQGLSHDQISDLKKTTYNKESSEDNLCTICYCNFQKGDKLINLKCKHYYHDQCIGKWLEHNCTCPICKYKIEKRQQQ